MTDDCNKCATSPTFFFTVKKGSCMGCPGTPQLNNIKSATHKPKTNSQPSRPGGRYADLILVQWVGHL